MARYNVSLGQARDLLDSQLGREGAAGYRLDGMNVIGPNSQVVARGGFDHGRVVLETVGSQPELIRLVRQMTGYEPVAGSMTSEEQQAFQQAQSTTSDPQPIQTTEQQRVTSYLFARPNWDTVTSTLQGRGYQFIQDGAGYIVRNRFGRNVASIVQDPENQNNFRIDIPGNGLTAIRFMRIAADVIREVNTTIPQEQQSHIQQDAPRIHRYGTRVPDHVSQTPNNVPQPTNVQQERSREYGMRLPPYRDDDVRREPRRWGPVPAYGPSDEVDGQNERLIPSSQVNGFMDFLSGTGFTVRETRDGFSVSEEGLDVNVGRMHRNQDGSFIVTGSADFIGYVNDRIRLGTPFADASPTTPQTNLPQNISLNRTNYQHLLDNLPTGYNIRFEMDMSRNGQEILGDWV